MTDTVVENAHSARSGGAQGTNGSHPQSEADRLLERLEDPRTAAALNTIVDNLELLAVLVAGLDGLARKGEVIGDTLAEVLHEVRATAQSTGLDPATTAQQLATVIPTLADASPAINRVLESPIVEPEPIEVLSDAATAAVTGLKRAQANDTQMTVFGAVRATRDPDVQRGIGYAIEVLRALGQDLATDRRPG